MRVIVFFDLPSITSKDRRAYAKFRGKLIGEGFFMMQESVYSKLVLNPTAADLVKKRLKTFLPPDGLIQVLTITEKQYASIENILGEMKTDVVNDMERLTIL